MIYLDHNATTPIKPEVLEAQMIRFSLGLENTPAEVKAALNAIERAANMLRS